MDERIASIISNAFAYQGFRVSESQGNPILHTDWGDWIIDAKKLVI